MHTKGPWRANEAQGTILADSDEGITVGGGLGPSGKENYGGYLIAESVSTANLAILAAAPELLETLDGALQFIELMGMKVPEEFKLVVAKAKGLFTY